MKNTYEWCIRKRNELSITVQEKVNQGHIIVIASLGNTIKTYP